MKTKTLPVLLLILALTACAQAPETPTPPGPFVPITPTIFQDSPVPPLNTPVPGGTPTSPVQPFASFTPLSPTQQLSSGGFGKYAVILIPGNEMLNIRSGPGEGNAIVGTLQPDQSGLVRTGKTSGTGEDTWTEIENPSGGTGWVNARFLTEEIPPSTFCGDARVTSLLGNLETAVKTTNGDMLKTLVSPAHGLDVIFIRDGTIANYSPEEAGWAFQSTYEVEWGLGPGSGAPVKGTFPALILPALQSVTQNTTMVCNEIKLGGASYQAAWPARYANINFYSLHNPGTSQNGSLDWRTWLAGVEYVNGQPYLFSLLNYQWEP